MRPPPNIEAGALWLSRLDPAHDFSAAERAKVLGAFSTIERFEPGALLWGERRPRFDPFVLVDGLAACQHRTGLERSHVLTTQIVGILVPGDLCDGMEPMDAPDTLSVRALSTCRVAFVRRDSLTELIASSPKLAGAVRRLEMEQRRTVREWLVNLSSRSAAGRLANIFCELFERLSRVGLVRKSSFELPLTQQELANAAGLSLVHANRMIQQLRQDGLIRLSRGTLEVLDFERLADIGGFRPGSYYGEHAAPLAAANSLRDKAD